MASKDMISFFQVILEKKSRASRSLILHWAIGKLNSVIRCNITIASLQSEPLNWRLYDNKMCSVLNMYVRVTATTNRRNINTCI